MVDADAQVTAWLRGAGLSRFAPRFAAALISPHTFLQLSLTDLDALGVDSPADRKRLSDLITELRRTASHSPPRRCPPRPSKARSRLVLDSLIDRNTLPPGSLTTISSLKPHSQDSQSTLRTSQSAAIMPVTSVSRAEPSATVTVCVRKRPLSRKEVSSGDRDVVTVHQSDATLAVHELKEKVDLTKYVETHPFSFDHVFGEHVENSSVYEATARPLVDTLFSGGRATCFAYGQTGAGKTFTMAGDSSENPGLYTLAVRDVFDRIRDQEREAWRGIDDDGDDEFEPPDPPQVWISFYEIYASRLQDLLNNGAKLECREDGNSEVQIVGLSERLCEVEEDVLALIQEGSRHRSTGVTGANDDSSRSHAVFQIELREPPTSNVVQDQNTVVRNSLLRAASGMSNVSHERKGEEIGRLCFIDLAGSERGSDTASSTRQTRMEGAEINKSLLALKECIRAMDKKKDHTPFRGSKLTQVLKASFLGKNCSTVMIANISPASSNVEHTLNTLRYSDRVKELRKDRVSNAANLDSKANSRRATILNASQSFRNGVNSAQAFKASVPHADDFSDEGNSTNVRKSSDLQRNSFNGKSDGDDFTRSGGQKTQVETNKRLSRVRVRVSDFPQPSTQSMPPSDEQTKAGVRDKKHVRRGATKPREHIPPRPMFASSLLQRMAGKSGSNDRSLPRTESATRVIAATDIDNSSDVPNKITGKSSNNDQELRQAPEERPPPPMLTRRRARELEARQMEEGKSGESLSDSRDDPSEAIDSQTEPNAPSGRRVPRASNVAESAMKFYKTHKKEELADEDLLFSSFDDLTGAIDTAQSEPVGAGKKNRASKKDIKPGSEVKVITKKTAAENRGKSSSCSETEVCSSLQNSSQVELSADAKQVVRMHHTQIEELVRLAEADVALVQAVEKGEMDVQEYALKLGVNLSQKIDIVRTLQTKLKVLD